MACDWVDSGISVKHLHVKHLRNAVFQILKEGQLLLKKEDILQLVQAMTVEKVELIHKVGGIE